MFEKFPSLTRFSQDWTVTEKIDGSNAQVLIMDENSDFTNTDISNAIAIHAPKIKEMRYFVFAGSRSRFLTPTKQGDHMGFAQWVENYSEELVATLGTGRHYGEWWGQGIQRGYGLTEKRFSLFNVSRWKEEDVSHIPQLHVVPSFVQSAYYDNPGASFTAFLNQLRDEGSLAAPGYMNPEGIVMYHGRSGTMFKKTFDYDEYGKWKERENASA